MGRVIKQYELSMIQDDSLVIYTNNSLDKGISINEPLAKRLIYVPKNMRTLKLLPTVSELLNQIPSNSVIVEFDVLFNPEYKIDVLSFLIELRKKYIFKIIWPGKFENNCLVYSEYGYKDYKKYDISSYNITCVV